MLLTGPSAAVSVAPAVPTDDALRPGAAWQPAAGARAQAGEWAGNWAQSNALGGGTWIVRWTQSGDRVSGSFWGFNWLTPVEMRFEGTVSLGVLQGTWTSDDPAYANGTRTVQIALAPDGNSWQGVWGWWIPGGSEHADGEIRGTRADDDPDDGANSAPAVRALPFKGLTKPGRRITLTFTVKDDSGRAKTSVRLYEGGQGVKSASYSGKATGKKQGWRVGLPADLVGPMFFCVWAKDAQGNKSAGAPRSSCAWIAMAVDIARVSNGCGGKGWDAVVAAENYFGNTSTYYGEDGTPYTVDFETACDVHDAGYGGHTVYDRFTGVTIDFHGWSRQEVDEKFRMDMDQMCDRQIPAEEQQALAECKTNFRYATVRTLGGFFFDADPSLTGTQDAGTREND